MTSTFIGELPAGWKSVPLKHLTSFLSRGTPPVYVDEAPIRAISQAANQECGIVWERTRFHKCHGAPELLKGHLVPNDIIINSTGTGTLGRVGYFSGAPDGVPCIADSHLTIVRLIPESLVPRFGFYWLKSEPFQEFMLSTMTAGSTNQIELSRERLGDSPTPVPPLEEQRRIAAFLDAETSRIDALISTQQRLEVKLLERREAGVAALISGMDHHDRKPSQLPWLTDLPADWQVVRLGLIARMGSGHTPNRSREDWWENPTIPWITTGEVKQVRDDRREVITETREKISELGLGNSAAELHPAGTVVLCRTASAGYSAVMGADMATSQDFVTWTCGPRLDPFYLLWCLRAMRQDLLGRLAMGSTHKTIYVPDLQMLRIPLPSLDEQRSIVARIRSQNSKIDRLIDAVRRQSELLAERRRALITAAVTGEFDVSTASGRGIED